MLRNIKPLIWTAQVLGASIFKVSGRKLKISNTQIIYFTVLYILNTTHLMYAVYLTLNDNKSNLRRKMLSLTRTSLGFVCLTVDTVMTTTLKDQLKSFLECLHVYDTSSRFNLNYSKHRIVNPSRIAVITLMAWWSIVGFIALQINSASYSYFFAFSYVHFCSSTSLQIFIFCGFTLLIHQRFNHLGRIMTKNTMRLRTNERERSSCNIELQDVWWLHSKLIDAAEKLNHVYSMQILLWIFSFSLNCLSRIYTLTNDRDSGLFTISRDLLCLIGCFINVFVIIIACHLTGYKANQIAKKLFSPTSNISMKTTLSRNDNAAIAYFCVKKLHFFGAYGLIQVHLPLLISIVGAITTYLVILHKQ